jgi:hypothetical protein
MSAPSCGPCCYKNVLGTVCGASGWHKAKKSGFFCPDHRCADCPVGMIRKMVNGRNHCGACIATYSRDRVTPVRVPHPHPGQAGMTCDWHLSAKRQDTRCGARAKWVTARGGRGFCRAHRCPLCAQTHCCIRKDGLDVCAACRRRHLDNERRDEATVFDED